MPIYEYVCSNCGSKFELLRSLSQANEKVSCPHCHNHAERKLSTFACFTTSEAGIPTPLAGSGNSCSSCSASNCTTCGL